MMGGESDQKCPNVLDHGHQHNPRTLIRRLSRLFPDDLNFDSNLGCESLHTHGTHGALSKLPCGLTDIPSWGKLRIRNAKKSPAPGRRVPTSVPTALIMRRNVPEATYEKRNMIVICRFELISVPTGAGGATCSLSSSFVNLNVFLAFFFFSS